MAKKKAKRKLATKPSAPRSRKPFAGDQVLAIYQIFGSCCSFTSLLILASFGAGLTMATDLKQQVLRQIKEKEIHNFIANISPTLSIVFFALAAFLLIFSILYIRATWQGRKWAIWLHFLLNFPSAILAINFGTTEVKLGILIPVIISIYCLLRIMGSVGPKL